METRPETKLEWFKPEDIEMGERFRKDYGDLEEFAAGLKEKGIMHPVAVMDRGPGEKVLLIAGGRRYAGAVIAELPKIPANVYPQMDELDYREMELLENFDREDLKHYEEADLTAEIHRLQLAKYGQATPGSKTGASIGKTASLIGRSKAAVAQDLELSDAMQDMPELREAKNKKDAMTTLRHHKEDMVRKELAKRLQKDQGKDNTALQKKKLMDAYIVGDFFEGAKDIPDEAFHFIEVDPPYGIDLTRVKRAEDEGVTAGYNEVSSVDYPEFLRRTFKECFRILREGGWLVCWFAPEPWFAAVLSALRTAGFDMVAIPGFWYKTDGPGQTNQPSIYMPNDMEPFFYCRKGEASLVKQGRSNVFPYPKVHSDKKVHPTERPVEMIQAVISTFTEKGMRMLVPFLGSGNSLLAGSNLGLQAVGYDLGEAFKDRYVLRVAEGDPGKYRSFG